MGILFGVGVVIALILTGIAFMFSKKIKATQESKEGGELEKFGESQIIEIASKNLYYN